MKLDYQNDQASSLRKMMAAPRLKVISVLAANNQESQESLVTNLASYMQFLGKDVLIIDNSEASKPNQYKLGKQPTLLDLCIKSEKVSVGIKRLEDGVFVTRMMPKEKIQAPLSLDHIQKLNVSLQKLSDEYEILLVDLTLNNNEVPPIEILAEGEIIIQLNSHPESIKQAYALIKRICNQLGRRPFGVIVNGTSQARGEVIFKNIAQVAKRFMQVELSLFGVVPADEHLSRAEKLGRSVIDAFPLSEASIAFKSIAQILGFEVPETPLLSTGLNS